MNKNILILITILVVSVLVVGCASIANIPDDKVDISNPKDETSNDQESTVNKDALIDPVEEEDEFDIAIGKLAPDLYFNNSKGEKIFLENLIGEVVSLEDYRGKIVLLNFWATWCKFCNMEMPDLQKLQDENDDIVIIAVDVMEDKATVEKYVEKGDYDFQVVLDEEGNLAKTYLVSGMPTTYFIDKEGILLGGIPSMLKYDQLVSILDGIRENEE